MVDDVMSTRQVGERIERLLGSLRSVDGSVAMQAEELVGLLVRMYGDGLGRIIDSLDDDQVRSLGADPVIGSLLALHDLHPDDVETRVEMALEKVRPYLGSHAGGVEVLGVDESGTARLRLHGSCDGCPSSTVTVKMAIEGAIFEAAPEIIAVEVEGVSESVATEAGLLQITRKPSSVEPRWVNLVGSVPDAGQMQIQGMGDFDILIAATPDHVYAYRGDCPGCGASMGDGELQDAVVSCSTCHRRYDLVGAGRSLDDHLVLAPIPLVRDNGSAKIALPEVVA